MAKKILMNVAEGDECRIAVIEDGRLYEYFVDRPSQLKHLGNIYKGLVSNVEPGIQAAFVDLGMDRNGFLHVSDTLNAYARIQNVAELYKPVSRVGNEAEMPPYTEQVPPQSVAESDFVDSPQSTSDESHEESGSNGHEPAAPPAPAQTGDAPATNDDEAEGESETQRHSEPEFLDKLTQVSPGHNVTHSPTEVLNDRQAPEPFERSAQPKPPEPDVTPGVVNEHEALGYTPQPKPPRKKRPQLDVFKPVDTASDFQLPPPPKKKARPSGQFPAVPDSGQTPEEPRGNFDRDGQSTSGEGSDKPRAFMRGPLPKIQNLLKRGQEVLVQVTKASQGGKGPGLSTYLSLPGRYMVLMPNSNKGGVSRKIEDDAQRDALRRILDSLPVPQGMGVVIRTAAIGRTFDELNRDLNYLLRLWNVIVTRMHEAEAPALIYADTDPAIRAVRDYFTADTDEIIIDDKSAYERVLAFFDMIMPSFKERVKLYEKDVPLFYAEGIETQIDHIFDKKVPLKSGGYLYIEQTEALVAIDVNSGKFTSAGDAEQTAYRTNLEAIPEIVRQLRLRDLGGIICNDLIDMLSPSHRADVENALKRELRKDRARTKIARMSPFGVIEMTRQRVRPSIRAYTYVSCPTCSGSGHVRSAETLCLTLVRQMKLALAEERVKSLIVQVHPHVLSHLHSEFREDIDQLEETYDKRIIFEFARDLVLGDTRIFYINDRDARVLYDLDQKINQYVKEAEYQSKVNVALPPASLGVAGQPEPEVRFSDRRGRRGGRRQRDRDLERQTRMLRSQAESAKAVPSFGAEMPELPTVTAPAEGTTVPVAAPENGERRREFRDRRDRRDRGRDRGRERREPQPQANASSGVAAPEGAPGATEQPANPAQAPAVGAPAQPGQPTQGDGQGRRRRGRRGGRRRREREERRRQAMQQGQSGQPQPAEQAPVAEAGVREAAPQASLEAQPQPGEREIQPAAEQPGAAPRRHPRRERGPRPQPAPQTVSQPEPSAPAPQPVQVPAEAPAAPAEPLAEAVEAGARKPRARKAAEPKAKRTPAKKEAAKPAAKTAKKPAARKTAAKKPPARKSAAKKK
ncbi:Rne/Rng family ribonuclease [bacterium]|nr:MAG: Rne/Rng family ribonuclease [bacterium]RIK64453.1 MAG: hypothetical protein DCC64_04775 [Planctomycetota bacterium]